MIGNSILEKSLSALSGSSRLLAVHTKSVVEQGCFHAFAFDNTALRTFLTDSKFVNLLKTFGVRTLSNSNSNFVTSLLLTSQFLSVLSSFNLTRLVDFATHNKDYILDLVISSSDCSLAPSLMTTLCSVSDHFPVVTKLFVHDHKHTQVLGFYACF